MLTLKELNDLGVKYIQELEEKGRRFYPIEFRLKSRKSSQNYGKAIVSYERQGYDIIEINQYMKDPEDVKNTIIHEIAHLDHEARGHGHGPKWKKVARMYSRWYDTEITTTSHKELEIPGMVEVHVVWSDECLLINKHLPRFYKRTYTSEKRAMNFVRKFNNMGFIDDYKIVKN